MRVWVVLGNFADLLAATGRAAPSSELNGCQYPNDEPKAAGENSEQQVQDVIWALAKDHSCLTAILAVAALLLLGHIIPL